MKPAEFRTLQARARLLNRDVERVFGVSDQTVINWRHGHTRIPESAAALIRIIARGGENNDSSRMDRR